MAKCAVLSDIHGNVTALDAVLSDIRRRNIDTIICLGDLVGKGPQSAKAVDTCRRECSVVVKGNWDDMTADTAHPPINEMTTWLREQLGPERMSYLNALPVSHDFERGGKSIRLFHASSRGIHHRVHMDDTKDIHYEMFSNTDFTGFSSNPEVIGYGDIHCAYMKNLGSRILFNTGSVGNPLDQNQASFVILEENKNSQGVLSLQFQFIRVPYDIEAEIEIARAMNMPDFEPYCRELRTGTYRGNK